LFGTTIINVSELPHFVRPHVTTYMPHTMQTERYGNHSHVPQRISTTFIGGWVNGESPLKSLRAPRQSSRVPDGASSSPHQ